MFRRHRRRRRGRRGDGRRAQRHRDSPADPGGGESPGGPRDGPTAGRPSRTMATMTWFFAVLVVARDGRHRGGRRRPGRLHGGDVRRPAGLPGARRRPLTADDLRRVRFTTAFRGYRMSEVDALLDRLAAELDPVRPQPEQPADDGPPAGPATGAAPDAGPTRARGRRRRSGRRRVGLRHRLAAAGRVDPAYPGGDPATPRTRLGGRFRAWTGLGAVGFWDPMTITAWERGPDGGGRCEVLHSGAVVKGEGEFAVVARGPAASGSCGPRWS